MAESSTVSIPQKQKAAIYDQPGKISTKVVEIDVPEPGAGEILVNFGVCHSDLAVMTNTWKTLPYPTQPGQIGGHEGVGKIVKLGPGTESSGFKIGDRVGIKWVWSACQNCPACLVGLDGTCLNQKVSGYYTPGTFQQYALSPANYATRIPDGLSGADAAPMLCAGVTVYTALNRSRALPGQWVVISGVGGLGHLACQLASRGMGLRVIAIDHGSKEALARESGAEHFIDFTKLDKEGVTKQVRSLTGGLGAHAAVVCTAANAAYAQAIDLLRFGGTLVCVGIPEGEYVNIDGANPGVITTKQLTITGSAVGNRGEAIRTLEFAERGIIKAHYEISRPENLTDIFERMEQGKLQGRVVLDLS
ncbi:hypothetical protein ZTR_03354 [Talaromyces verruculosus]|nr:hypothetical protein ZTR_03354 [Talaromyces verruculosus]